MMWNKFLPYLSKFSKSVDKIISGRSSRLYIPGHLVISVVYNISVANFQLFWKVKLFAFTSKISFCSCLLIFGFFFPFALCDIFPPDLSSPFTNRLLIADLCSNKVSQCLLTFFFIRKYWKVRIISIVGLNSMPEHSLGFVNIV